MANVKMNYTELTAALALTPYDQNILLIGRHGIGKSQVLTDFYETKGMKVVPLFLGQMSDPGDILGLPKEKKVTHADVETYIMDFLPPAWWSLDQPIVLFLDEINRGRPEILQVVFDVCLNRKVGGRSLPEGSMVVAAANFGEEYQVTDLDPALVSRFNIYELDPTVDEWLSWAASKGIDHRVISFISTDNSQLDPRHDENADSMDKTPDRRAWVRVSDIMKNIKKPGQLEMKIIAGIVGSTATSLFNKHITSMVTVDAKTLLFSKKFETVQTELMIMTMQDLLYLNKNVFTYVLTHQDDIRKTTAKQKTACSNFLSYIEFLKENEQNETIADIIQQFEKQPKVASLFLSDDRIMDIVQEFIDDVDLK